MAASTPERVSATPPLEQPAAPLKSRLRKGAKVIEAQQSLGSRTTTTVLRPTQNELPPFPTASASVSPERERSNTSLEEVAALIANLRETIAQQNSVITNQSSVIESVRADLAEIKSEQRSLKKQIAELQKAVRSLRAQPNTPSAPTQSWASVAASGDTAGLEMTLPLTTSARNSKGPNRQLVIDVSRAGEEAAEKVATTEAAKQTIAQGIKDFERLTGAVLKDFRVWRTSDSASVIKSQWKRTKRLRLGRRLPNGSSRTSLGRGLSDPSGMRSRRTGLKYL